MSPLEIAARTLAKRRYNQGGACDSGGMDEIQFADSYWPEFAVDARAVILSLRIPSDDMVKAGAAELDFDDGSSFSVGAPRHLADNVFRAMIDALLVER